MTRRSIVLQRLLAAARSIDSSGDPGLRHSYGSYLDAAGIAETRQRRYMGHSLGDVTERYRHQFDGQLAKDAKLLDR
jgi:integrase